MFKMLATMMALALVAKLSMGMVSPTVSKIEARKQQIEAAISRY